MVDVVPLAVLDEPVVVPLLVPEVEVLWACVPWVPMVDEPVFEANWPLCFEVLFEDVLPLPDFEVPAVLWCMPLVPDFDPPDMLAM